MPKLLQAQLLRALHVICHTLWTLFSQQPEAELSSTEISPVPLPLRSLIQSKTGPGLIGLEREIRVNDRQSPTAAARPAEEYYNLANIQTVKREISCSRLTLVSSVVVYVTQCNQCHNEVILSDE